MLQQAIQDHVADVRGYFYWSLTDNFEWASGYYPKFGLYAPNPKTHRLKPRKSARIYGRIAKANAIPADLLTLYGP